MIALLLAAALAQTPQMAVPGVQDRLQEIDEEWEDECLIDGVLSHVCGLAEWEYLLKDRNEYYNQMRDKNYMPLGETLITDSPPITVSHQTPLSDEEIERLRIIIAYLTCQPNDIEYGRKLFCINFDAKK